MTLSKTAHLLLGLGLMLASMGIQPAKAAVNFVIDLNGGVEIASERVARFVAVARNTTGQPGSALIKLGSPNCASEQDECKVANISSSGGVTGGGIVRLDGGPAYSATLAAGAAVTVVMDVRADYCSDGGFHAVAANASLKQLGGGTTTDSASVNMPCLPALGSGDFEATLLDGGIQALGPNRELPPGARLPVRIAMRNKTAGTLHLKADANEVACEDSGLLRADASPACRVSVGGGALNGSIIELAAGSIETITLGIDTRGSGEGARISGKFVLFIGGAGDPNSGTLLGEPGGYPVQTYTLNLPAITLRSNDLGDAPDSSNHAASAMQAYLAPATPANFPTVFDPALGVQGPLHRSPRELHLGRRASHETEADLGPDADPQNNLRPVLGLPNLDRADDGIRLSALQFANCATSTVEVGVFVSHAMLQQFKGNGLNAFPDDDDVFLNVWVDGNRDGDWADAAACAAGGPAAEHVVRNHRIRVATLGAGLNRVLVPTSNALWDASLANKPAWLRVTLGDIAAPTPLTFGALQYGDGRGPATAYALGETEDYIWRPAADRAPALDVKITGSVLPASHVEPFVNASSVETITGVLYDKATMQFIVDVTNIGDKPLKNVTLNLRQFGFGVGGDISVRQFNLGGIEDVQGWYGCITCTVVARGDSASGGFVLNLGRAVVSGTTRFVVNVTKAVAAGVAQTANDAASAAADAAAGLAGEASGEEDDEGDGDGGLNRSAAVYATAINTSTISVASFMRHFKPVILTPRPGTTSEASGTVRGRGVPGTNVLLRLDARPVATATVDANGNFSHTYTVPLADGLHLLTVRAALGHLISEPTDAVVFKVDAGLLWSPMSLRVHRNGDVYAPANSRGRATENGWIAPLIPNQPHTITLRTHCASTPTASWTVDNQTFNATIHGEYARIVFTPSSAWPVSGTVTQSVTCGSDGSESTGRYILNSTAPALARAADAQMAETETVHLNIVGYTCSGGSCESQTFSHVESQMAGMCGSSSVFHPIEWEVVACGSTPKQTWSDWNGFSPQFANGGLRVVALKGNKQPALTRQLQFPGEPRIVSIYALPEVNDEVIVMFRSDGPAQQAAKLINPIASTRPAVSVLLGDQTGTLGHVRVPRGSVISIISAGDSIYQDPVLGWYGCITCTLARAGSVGAAPESFGSTLPPLGSNDFKFDQAGIYTIGDANRPDDIVTVEVVNQVFLPALAR